MNNERLQKAVLVLLVLASNYCPGGDEVNRWGDVRGRIVSKTQGESAGLSDTVVWMYRRGDEPLPIHSFYDEKLYEVQIEKGQWNPRVIAFWSAKAISFPNARQQGIAIHLDGQFQAPGPEERWYISGKKSSHYYGLAMTALGKKMPLGYVFPVNNPYSAVTNDKGEFKIEKIPEGPREFYLWHPEFKNARILDAKFVDEKPVGTLTRGRLDVRVIGGKNQNLGDILIELPKPKG